MMMIMVRRMVVMSMVMVRGIGCHVLLMMMARRIVVMS